MTKSQKSYFTQNSAESFALGQSNGIVACRYAILKIK